MPRTLSWAYSLGVTDEAANAAASSGGLIAGGSVACVVGVVIFATVTATLEGISRGLRRDNLPGQLAGDIEGAYTQAPDVASLITTTTGAQGLFALLAAATTSPSLSTVPGPANTDPVFAVQEQGSTSTTYSNSITWVDSSGQGASTTSSDSSSNSSSDSSSATPSTDSARVSGTTWFVEQLAQGTADAMTVQTLTIHYTDRTGTGQTAWLLDTPSGYSFVGTLRHDPAGTGVRPLNLSSRQALLDQPIDRLRRHRWQRLFGLRRRTRSPPDDHGNGTYRGAGRFSPGTAPPVLRPTACPSRTNGGSNRRRAM